MKYAVIFGTILLAGCQTDTKPSVVREVVPQRSVQVPAVTPPPPFQPARFKFQRPEQPNAVVAMDPQNYNMFREFMLGINKREIEWNNKLEQANRSLLLLQGITEPATQPTTGVPQS